MTEKKSYTVPIVFITIIATASLAVAGTLFVLDAIEDNSTQPTSEGKVEFTQTGYGAYATYTMNAECTGTLRASDGSTFLVNGESTKEFAFQQGTYKLTLYGGATPEVVKG